MERRDEKAKVGVKGVRFGVTMKNSRANRAIFRDQTEQRKYICRSVRPAEETARLVQLQGERT